MRSCSFETLEDTRPKTERHNPDFFFFFKFCNILYHQDLNGEMYAQENAIRIWFSKVLFPFYMFSNSLEFSFN
jgi:hypothetical protein